MMKNVTITLEDDVENRARTRASEDRTGFSRWNGGLLRKKMQDESGDGVP